MRDTVEVAAALVEACMKGEAAHSTLRRRVGLNHESFAVYVEACTAAGLIARTPNGRYSATQRGARFLELQRLREHHIREAETLTEALLYTTHGKRSRATRRALVGTRRPRMEIGREEGENRCVV